MTARPRESKRIGRIVKGQRLDQLTIRMPRATREQLAQLAELLGVSDSAAVVEMLQKRLDAMTPKNWQALTRMREARARLSTEADAGVPFAEADRIALSSDDLGHRAKQKDSSLAQARREGSA